MSAEETFVDVVNQALSECAGTGMTHTDAIKHVMRAVARKLDEDRVVGPVIIGHVDDFCGWNDPDGEMECPPRP